MGRCGMAGQTPWPRVGRLMPGRCLTLAALLLVTACGDFLDNIPERPAASNDPAIAEADYPSLSAVPARPQLTYTLEQKREIAQGLVADRANARYAGNTVRQDLGRPVQPDTAPPLPPLPAPAIDTARDDPEGDLALAYVEEALARDSDDGSLGDFLERLERQPPASAEAGQSPTSPADDPTKAPELEPESEVQPAVEAGSEAETETASEPATAVEPLPPEPEVATASSPSEPATSLPASPADRPDETVGASVAVPEAAAEREPAAVEPAPVEATEDEASAGTIAAAPPAAAEPAPASLPFSVLFEPGAVELADQVRDQLQRLTSQLAGDTFTIVVSGGGERAGLAMERARRVAAMLVSGGIGPARIAIEMGGESDVVVVYEAGARS